MAHPQTDDPATTEALLHIAICAHCQETHDSEVIAYAKGVHDTMTVYNAMMGAGSDGNR